MGWVHPRPLIRLLYLTLILLLQLGEANAENKEKIVEIYNQNKYLIGTGTSISFSGLILTAKHVLEDRGEVGSRTPNYFLKVNIRRYQRKDYEQAELLAVHPHMDLAILINRAGQPIPPATIGGIENLEKNDEVTIIGHDKGFSVDESKPISELKDDAKPIYELYKVLTAKVDEIDRHGHIILGRGVDQGTSGGPVFYQDHLIGVIRNSSIDRTTVVPLQYAWAYFKLIGVELTDRNLAKKTNHIGELASKVGDYEKILMDIQMDVNWIAEMIPVRETGAGLKSKPKDVALKLWYQKKLNSQPDFETLVSIDVTPIFSGKIFESLLLKDRKTFPRSGWLVFEEGVLRFGNFGKDIEFALNKYPSNLGIKRQDFIGFDIIGTIDSIQGKGYIRLPEKHKVCFKLRLDGDSKLFLHNVRAKSCRCQ